VHLGALFVSVVSVPVVALSRRLGMMSLAVDWSVSMAMVAMIRVVGGHAEDVVVAIMGFLIGMSIRL
jgi:hypothetical protein